MSADNDKPFSDSTVDLTVDIAGLIEIFGDSLYNEFGAIVKELVQNAHDAIVKKYAENVVAFSYDEKVIVKFDHDTRSLIVFDSGVGMNKDELAKELNNFARSQKKVLGKAIKELATGASNNLQIIGEFGVGFLSALATSDQVSVWSKRSDQNPFHWKYSKGASRATIVEETVSNYTKIRSDLHLPIMESGSILICTLTQEVIDSYYIDEDLIRNSVVKYASILPMQVYFENELISCKYKAWAKPAIASKKDWADYIEEKTGSAPLLTIPIYSPPDELNLQGVLWIPPRSFIQEHSSIEIYVKRMFVMEDFNLLLPNWAKFINGVINSNLIRRIVSGNVIKVDMHSEKAKEFISAKVIQAFDELHALSDEQYWNIIGPHDDTIKESAADHLEFLQKVWDKLFISGRNDKYTIPEYCSIIEQRTNLKNTVFYYDKAHQEFSANQVSDSTGIPVLSLRSRADNLFVKKVCEMMRYQLMNFNEIADKIFTIPTDVEYFNGLVKACAFNNIMAEIRSFQPAHIPAMLVENDNINELREGLLRKVKILKEFGFREFDDYDIDGIEKMLKRGNVANAGVSFYLNAESDLIKALAKAPFETQSSICLVLFHISYMSAMPTLGKSEVTLIFNSITSVLKNLTNVSMGQMIFAPNRDEDDSEEASAKAACRPIRIFMITPFADKYKHVEMVVKHVFEGEPYFFEVVLARDIMLENKILDSIRSHIDLADAFIAEISDLNPNVMMELGAVLFNNERKRPVFALRSNDSKDIPIDFGDNIYINYGNITDEFEEIVQKIKEAIERKGNPSSGEILKLLELRTCKALNSSLLSKLSIKFKDENEKLLLKNYSTIENFLHAENQDISRKIKMRESVILILKEEINQLLE